MNTAHVSVGQPRSGVLTIAVAMVYLIAGLAFARLANSAHSPQFRFFWRLAAWIFSAAAFTYHIFQEHFRLRQPPMKTALHAAAAVALGMFGLAVAANIHAYTAAAAMSPSAISRHRRLLRLSLIIWPVIAGVPAFVVALAGAWVIGWFTRDSMPT